MKEFFVANNDKAFRAKQVHEWIWKKSATSFSEMTNLSKSTRSFLEENFSFSPVSIDNYQQSSDGTVKYGLKLADGNLIEAVLIPTSDRITVCISSQVGCSLSCKFCATGYLERMRNLESSEIYDQVVLMRNEAERHFDRPLTNIVYMGMGEPLLNYKNVMESIHHITSPEGLNMASRRITVSTAGIAKMIRKLGDDAVKFNLALSLHAANDDKRDDIMPINESNSLDELGQALDYFYELTGTKFTLEYIIFNEVNDSIEDAKELLAFAKDRPCKVNIIEYNPIEEADYLNASEDKVLAFSNYLEKNKVIVNVRRSRGKDIDAACGQLAGKK